MLASSKIRASEVHRERPLYLAKQLTLDKERAPFDLQYVLVGVLGDEDPDVLRPSPILAESSPAPPDGQHPDEPPHVLLRVGSEADVAGLAWSMAGARIRRADSGETI
jgi:hypothetical protein